MAIETNRFGPTKSHQNETGEGMSEIDSARRAASALMTSPGVAELLLAFRVHEGTATVAQLRQAGVSDPLAPLRALAAGGHVSGPGSFDHAAPDEAVFHLSHTGVGLADVMADIEILGRRMVERQARRGFGILAKIRSLAHRAGRGRPDPSLTGNAQKTHSN
jgi:hypothetical protein